MASAEGAGMVLVADGPWEGMYFPFDKSSPPGTPTLLEGYHYVLGQDGLFHYQPRKEGEIP